MKKLNKKGFTLIELLVVIAIIGLLSTLAVVAFGNTRIKARDSKRQSDLKVFQTAIEMYITDNAAAPDPGAPAAATDRWDGVANNLESLLADYLPGGLPEDPSSTVRKWIYCYGTGASADSRYMVATSLEQNKAIAGDLDSVSNWAATECIVSDDGEPANAAPVCADSNGGTIDTDTTATAVCLGSDDS
ncbi:MAG: type II secretion system protein [Patescibacteria group bacterium]|nr:type II secretion system protein [Patescibacteria group bacterium]